VPEFSVKEILLETVDLLMADEKLNFMEGLVAMLYVIV
jgi:hypothetical protein